jgi:hypothetical protein
MGPNAPVDTGFSSTTAYHQNNQDHQNHQDDQIYREDKIFIPSIYPSVEDFFESELDSTLDNGNILDTSLDWDIDSSARYRNVEYKGLHSVKCVLFRR